MLDSLGSVHGQDVNRRAADCGDPLQYGVSPHEMLFPRILSRVKEPREQSRLGVEARDIRPLVEIVIQTGLRQILGDGRAVMLLGNDVVDLERQRVERLGETTVFAGVRRTIPNVTFQGVIHRITRREYGDRRGRYELWREAGSGNFRLERNVPEGRARPV